MLSFNSTNASSLEKQTISESLELASKHVETQILRDSTNPLLEDQLKLSGMYFGKDNLLNNVNK